MNEYGEAKSLTEIIEELAVYCFNNYGDVNEIKIILPKKILDGFSLSYKSKERIQLFGEKPQEPNVIRAVQTFDGRIELFNADDNEVTLKEKV